MKSSAMMSSPQPPSPSVVVTFDASGTWGCGAFCCDESSAWKELAPVVIAVAIWGVSWKQQTILCLCDNRAVVGILRTRTSKTKVHLVRCLHFL